MANRSFINHHSLELLKTALPYLSPSMQKSVDVLSKADELMNTLNKPSSGGDLTTMSLSSPANMEDVLVHMKSACNKKEQDDIDNILNILKMQKFMQSYRAFTATKQPDSSNSNTAPSQDTMLEFLMSQLNPDQRNNFQNINMVLNSMNN